MHWVSLFTAELPAFERQSRQPAEEKVRCSRYGSALFVFHTAVLGTNTRFVYFLFFRSFSIDVHLTDIEIFSSVFNIW
jgi:hypothetical protein